MLVVGVVSAPAAPARATADIVVTTTADVEDGPAVSLREGIETANATPGPQTIGFAIPATDPGFNGSVFVIQVRDGLPSVTDDGTTIDGTTQTAFSGDTNDDGPEIVVNGRRSQGSHGLTLLSNGNTVSALVINGFGADQEPSGIRIEGSNNTVIGCYVGTDASGNPTDGPWSDTASLNEGRFGPTATRLPDGRVLVAGGGEGIDTAETYDAASRSWSHTGRMTVPRTGHTATLLPNGTVLVAGGMEGDNGAQNSAEVYDPATGVWTPTGSMAEARSMHVAALLPNGRVLVAGGGDPTCITGCSIEKSASAELYDPATGTWSPTASMNHMRLHFAAARLLDGRVLVSGGYDGSCDETSCGIGVWNNAEVYDPVAQTWTPTADPDEGRAGHTMTVLDDRRVLVAGGGLNDNSNPLRTAEIFDPTTGLWAPAGEMSTPRVMHASTLLGDGTVLVTGGSVGDEQALTASADLYDPVANEWRPVPDMTGARWFHTSTLLADGTVLIAAGAGDAETAQIYDPLAPSGNGVGIGLAFSSGAAISGNVIAGNFRHGVLASDGAANAYRGNTIFANGETGIAIESDDGDVIGGSQPGEGNTITGNGLNGVLLFSDSSNAVVEGNEIRDNLMFGVEAAGRGHRIGGVEPGSANVIEGNGWMEDAAPGGGVFLGPSGADEIEDAANHRLVGNRIAGSSGPGVVSVGDGNEIGGFDDGEGNTIVGNVGPGVVLAGSTNGLVAGNRIGVDDAGPNGNWGDGIVVGQWEVPAGPPNRVIQSAGNRITRNLIAHSGRGHAPGDEELGDAGVVVRDESEGTTLVDNEIRNNRGLGIDLGPGGVTPNDPGDEDSGPNRLQNFPELHAAAWSPLRLAVAGRLDTANPQLATIHFYSNPVPLPGDDPTRHGEGAVYLGSVEPGPSGRFQAVLPSVPYGAQITATATDVYGNTSEFARNIPAVLPLP